MVNKLRKSKDLLHGLCYVDKGTNLGFFIILPFPERSTGGIEPVYYPQMRKLVRINRGDFCVFVDFSLGSVDILHWIFTFH